MDVICRIASGELPAEVVARTDEVIAFLDHRPVFKGHVLVAPITHVPTVVELPADLLGPVWRLAQQVAAAFPAAFDADGSFMAVNTVVSQSVPHLHVHVVPRRRHDGLRGFFWPRTSYAQGEAAQYAARLRAALTTA